jgi:hypothetical protein
MKIRNRLFVCCALFALVGCSNDVNYSDYLSYLANPENGMVKETRINGLSLQAKYLPTEYFVFRALSDVPANEISQQLVDSISEDYGHSLTFMFTLAPDKKLGKEFDVTNVNTENYTAYEERMDLLNFQLSKYLHLEVDGQEMQPALVQMENTFGLKKESNFIVVFNVPVHEFEQQNHNMSLVYDDPVFFTGINRFSFSTEVIRNRPSLNTAYTQAS